MLRPVAVTGSAVCRKRLLPCPVLQAEGSPTSWAATWSAICSVWASKWSDRAWLSRKAVGVPDHDLFMSVLLQRVVPSQYAFVLHTKNPVSGKEGELLGEVVVGMGEWSALPHAARCRSVGRVPHAAHAPLQAGHCSTHPSMHAAAASASVRQAGMHRC